MKTFDAVVSNRDGEQDYRLAAEFTALIGLLNLLSALVPNLPEPVQVMEQNAPLGVNQVGRVIAGLACVALILLAGGLWRRVRVAYWLTMVFLAISIVNTIIYRQDLMVAVVSLVLAAWFTYLRPRFERPPALTGRS